MFCTTPGAILVDGSVSFSSVPKLALFSPTSSLAGLVVGLNDGAKLGAYDGAKLGANDGAKLGENVGLRLGE